MESDGSVDDEGIDLDVDRNTTDADIANQLLYEIAKELKRIRKLLEAERQKKS